jgi:putative FmdB family regulatory protein
MPTYEYACGACGHRFEEFQSITAKPIRKCPDCGKRTVERLLSGGAGFLFKGSGFYITDYRSEGYKQAAKKDSGGDSTASKSEGSSDKKPDKSDKKEKKDGKKKVTT